MCKMMTTTTVPQSLAIAAASAAAATSEPLFLVLANTVARAAEAAPRATCNVPLPGYWLPAAAGRMPAFPALHCAPTGLESFDEPCCRLTLDDDTRRAIARRADAHGRGGLCRANLAPNVPAVRELSLIRDWMLYDAANGEPRRVL